MRDLPFTIYVWWRGRNQRQARSVVAWGKSTDIPIPVLRHEFFDGLRSAVLQNGVDEEGWSRDHCLCFHHADRTQENPTSSSRGRPVRSEGGHQRSAPCISGQPYPFSDQALCEC